MPPYVSTAGAQGGTSARRTGAALSFVSCIRLLGVTLDFEEIAHVTSHVVFQSTADFCSL